MSLGTDRNHQHIAHRAVLGPHQRLPLFHSSPDLIPVLSQADSEVSSPHSSPEMTAPPDGHPLRVKPRRRVRSALTGACAPPTVCEIGTSYRQNGRRAAAAESNDATDRGPRGTMTHWDIITNTRSRVGRVKSRVHSRLGTIRLRSAVFNRGVNGTTRPN